MFTRFYWNAELWQKLKATQKLHLDAASPPPPYLSGNGLLNHFPSTLFYLYILKREPLIRLWWMKLRSFIVLFGCEADWTRMTYSVSIKTRKLNVIRTRPNLCTRGLALKCVWYEHIISVVIYSKVTLALEKFQNRERRKHYGFFQWDMGLVQTDGPPPPCVL